MAEASMSAVQERAAGYCCGMKVPSRVARDGCINRSDHSKEKEEAKRRARKGGRDHTDGGSISSDSDSEGYHSSSNVTGPPCPSANRNV